MPIRFAIAYHEKNQAGNNIVQQFQKLAFTPQTPIIKLKKETIFSENLNSKTFPEFKNIDLLVFASTHKSEKGNPSLCLHAPGNWRSADLGGQPGKICPTSAYVLKYLFQQLNKNYEKDKKTLTKEYNITLEVTHHGPLTEIPCIFIELGSQEPEWLDENAAKIVAKTILSLQNFDKKNFVNTITAIGIGGPHYAPVFNKIQLNSNYAISHIIPQHALPITPSMLQQAEEKTKEQIKEVLIDWKGCGKSEQRQQVINTIEDLGLTYKRTTNIEK
ncbi:hypothetical protein HOD75_01890 [archaeon]|jgi:D-aminoacyl-tRNA deacylase|nr:hypothetical protein [archaeon]MBT4241629.1 hypothetical protein [archaeon]MBT4418024.1 hypothetical protein [archaeon]